MREKITIAHNWDELRRSMWDYMGIVRTQKRLNQALARVQLLKAEVADAYEHHIVTRDLLELRHLIEVAELMVRCALSRKESRGLHTITDYPTTAPIALDTTLSLSDQGVAKQSHDIWTLPEW